MRIQLWQAFASNNSGSYTIVGRFADGAVAAAVAAELTEMIVAHSAWHRDHPWEDTDGSPLQAFVQARRLTWEPRMGMSDDWPDYGDDPVALVVGAQLVVHAPYTVSLPRTFGDLIRSRGGTVESCLDHAHHPLIVEVEVSGLDAAALIDELGAADHPLRGLERFALQAQPRPDAVVLRVVFTELVEGVRRIAEAVARRGGRHLVRILEAGDQGDPLGQPPLIHERARVIIERIGATRGAVVEVVRTLRHLNMSQAWHWLKVQPTDLGELPREWAERLAETLRAAGAKVTVVGA